MQIASITTNEQGEYEYATEEDYLEQTLDFVIQKEGFERKNISYEIDKAEIKSDILLNELEKGTKEKTKIFGTIRNLNNRDPVEDASITLSIEGVQIAAITSNKHGEYEYMAEEDYTGQTLDFIIKKEGFIKKNISSEIDRLEIKSDILLNEIEIEIKGKICDKADRPLADASISFSLGDKTIKLTSGKDGSFSFTVGQQFLNQSIGYKVSKEGFKVKSGKLELIEDLKCINLDPYVPFWDKNKVAVVLIALTVLSIVAFALPVLLKEEPKLSMDPGPVMFNFRPETGDQTILISNKGHGTLEWKVSSDRDWIVVSPVSGNDTGTVSVGVNCDGMSPGSYTGNIIVDSNGGTMMGSISLYIPVIGDELKVHDFSAEPESMDVAGNIKLNWDVSDDASITIDGIGPVDEPTGSIEKWVSEDTTFTIKVTNKAGLSDIKSITVTVGEEPTDLVEIKSFTADPSQISIGGESTLSWDVSGVDSVTIEPEIGIMGHTGEETVSPDESTTYTLTATNEAGISDARAVTVTVEKEMPILSTDPYPLNDLNYGTMNEGDTDSKIFSILNTGSGILEWSINTDRSWITVSPTSGTNSKDVTVIVDTTGLSLGNHEGTITIESNGGEPKQVNIYLIVSSEQTEVDSIEISPTVLISPKEDAVMDNGRTDRTDSIIWDFDWSDVKGATEYQLYVIGDTAKYPVIDRVTSSSSYHHSSPGSYIIESNRYGWTWKVRAQVNGQWGDWSETRTFSVEEVNTDSVSVENEIAEIPQPKLVFIGSEEYEVRGNQFTRYRLSVENWEEFPTILFETAPDLPPCGLNTEASRTWVNIYNAEGDRRLYGFCAFSSPKSLTSLWFAVQKGVTPPKAVYIELVDRREEKKYRSNEVTILQETTTQIIPQPKLTFIGSEEYEVRGNQFTRYRLSVENWEEFPTILFETAPDLPPCGLNTEASRTWVNIYNAEGDRRLYGFCAFSSPKSLTSLWFAVQKGVTPPKAVYIELVDRREEKKYSSNKVTIRRVMIGERIYPTIGRVLI
ncbi:MAG: hypothetical protein K8R34_09725 [Methanosarcinales archaeon]|nr:hypothetical protein [Methanosarcinales archaeon]